MSLFFCLFSHLESLVMDLHPTSKKRVVGDDVLFCCAAIGNPLPDYYEW